MMTSKYAIPSINEKSDGISALLVAQDRASRKQIVWTSCLITTLIVICLLGMDAVLLSYLCLLHQCQRSGLSIESTAPLGKVLTISQVISHVPPVLVPIIMGFFSYFLAAKWLRSSRDSNGGPNRPSPMHLALLMMMFIGSNIASLFSVKYLFQPQESIIQPPAILKQTIRMLGSLIMVTYIATAADAWLHASSTSILITLNSPYSFSVVPNFGREINSTKCALANNSLASNDIENLSCGLISTGSGGSGAMLAEGVRAVANASTLHRVVFADDQTAILVPETLPPNITYSASSLGVKTQCMTITKECMLPPTLLGGLADYGPDASLTLNCSMAGIKYVNGTGASLLCSLDNQGICNWQIPSNPFTAGQVITSFAYLGPTAAYDAFIPNTGWFVHGNNGAWNVVFCNVTALDVTYTYASSRYFLRSSTPKPLLEAQSMTMGLLVYGTNVIAVAVDGAGLQPNTTYEEAFALEFSRQMLARGTYIFEPRGVINVQHENNVNGSKLQIVPLVLFIFALFVFANQALYVFLRIIIASWGVEYVGLASLNLTNPFAALQRLYGHPDPMLTWEPDLLKKFGLETEGDRLCIGAVPLSGNGEHGSIFTLNKDENSRISRTFT